MLRTIDRNAQLLERGVIDGVGLRHRFHDAGFVATLTVRRT